MNGWKYVKILQLLFKKKGMTIQQALKQETKWSWCLFFFSTPYPFNWNTLIFSNVCYHSPFSCATSTSPTAKALPKTPWIPFDLPSFGPRPYQRHGKADASKGFHQSYDRGEVLLYIILYADVYNIFWKLNQLRRYLEPENIPKTYFLRVHLDIWGCLGAYITIQPSSKRPAQSFKTRGLELKPFELLVVCLIPLIFNKVWAVWCCSKL